MSVEPLVVFVDARCLQEPERTPSRLLHLAADLLSPAGRPTTSDIELVALTDSALPPLPPELVMLFDGVTTSIPPVARIDAFLQLSPMSHDPAPVARLISARFSAAVVDTPLRVDEERRTIAARLGHLAQLAWLRQYDLCFASSAARLAASGIRDDRVVSLYGVGAGAERSDWGGEAFWAPIVAGARRARHSRISGGRRRPARLAMVTPYAPGAGEIGVYSQKTAEALATIADVDVFTDSSGPVAGVRRGPVSAYPYIAREYDGVISVVGRTAQAERIIELVRRYGGACIVHHAELVPAVAGVANPVVVHSRLMVSRTPGGQPSTTTLPLCPVTEFDPTVLEPEARAPVRHRMRLGDQPLLASLCGESGAGALEAVYALDHLRAWGLPARLLLVGHGGFDGHDARQLARVLGLASFLGVSVCSPGDDEYQEALLAADFGIHLRPDGSLSATLMDCLTAGLPTVTNELQVEAADAPFGLLPVPDALSPLLIAEAVLQAFERGDHLERATRARAGYLHTRTFATYAARLLQVMTLEASATERPAA